MPVSIDIPPDQFLTLGGIRFHYLDWGGDGAPLLLLAGLGCTAHVFAEMAPHLTDRFRVLALTRRGHGLTDPVDRGHAVDDAAEDARCFLDALGIERAHAVGHSMGGGEVSTLAARHPGRVSSVVYLDGAYDWADCPAPEGSDSADIPDRFTTYEDFVAFARSVLPAGAWGPALEAMLRTSVTTHPDGSIEDKLPEAAYVPFVEALNSFRHPYADITAPALAIYAVGNQWEGDMATWRVLCRDRFAAEAAHGKVVEIEASHYVFLDHRDEVLEAMRAFLP